MNNLLILINIILIYLCIILASGFLMFLFRFKHKEFSKDIYNCYCDKCGIRLKFWMANLPLINFILLKGKCYDCKQKISILHPLIEFNLGIIIYLVVVLYV